MEGNKKQREKSNVVVAVQFWWERADDVVLVVVNDRAMDMAPTMISQNMDRYQIINTNLL